MTNIANPIDRQALVNRHKVILRKADFLSPLSVGNGEFCFTVDITGLQTFDGKPVDHPNGIIPLSTMSDWGWHYKPNPKQFSWETFPLTPFKSHGREVGYLYYAKGKCPDSWREASEWLYGDPNHFHLGKIGMRLRTSKGRDAVIEDISNIHQELDLWTGIITSRFTFDGEVVLVSTGCHGDQDQIGVRIVSVLIADGRLQIRLDFPYSSASGSGNGAAWNKPDAHQTQFNPIGTNRVDFTRTLDSTTYHVTMAWTSPAIFSPVYQHTYFLAGDGGSTRLEFSCAFSKTSHKAVIPDSQEIISTSQTMWKKFWTTGGAIDLSSSSDSRWYELERRIVLSQYLTRIQSTGTFPPQETGLTTNSWYGKFHMEMYWWHAAHFALWGREIFLEKSMPFYDTMLPIARKIASDQGYLGVRWPKCVGPEGTPAPNYIEAFLLWQQPHPIFLAELCYRAHPDIATLNKYQEIIFETADFMGSFPVWDSQQNAYVLGPPLTDAAEIYNDTAATNCNLNFEIAYWHFGLEIAQRWRERLGLPRNAHWDHILTHLPPLTTRDGVYVAGETNTETWTAHNHWSHPDMIGPLGMLDGAMVDHTIMRNTLSKCMQTWDHPSMWGWDFPEMAMCAARLGDGQAAINALLLDTPKNTYLPNGHNWQVPGLPLYLPGNGGLLYAVALMAAGWDGAEKINSPGFPQDGNWIVKWEGLRPAPADYHVNNA